MAFSRGCGSLDGELNVSCLAPGTFFFARVLPALCLSSFPLPQQAVFTCKILLEIISRLAFPQPQREEEEYKGRQSVPFSGDGRGKRGRESARESAAFLCTCRTEDRKMLLPSLENPSRDLQQCTSPGLPLQAAALLFHIISRESQFKHICRCN